MRLLKNVHCKQYGAFDVLDADKSVDCTTSSSFTICWLTSSIFLLLYTVGIPSLLFFILVHYESPLADRRFDRLDMPKEARVKLERRWNERAGRPPPPRQGTAHLLPFLQVEKLPLLARAQPTTLFTAFFRRKYEDAYWYWELVEIARKMILAGLLIFIAPDAAAQPLFGMLIALFFLMLQVVSSKQ